VLAIISKIASADEPVPFVFILKDTSSPEDVDGFSTKKFLVVLVAPIDTRPELSIVIAVEVALSSIPVELKLVNGYDRSDSTIVLGGIARLFNLVIAIS
jgi:hypothetical protein